MSDLGSLTPEHGRHCDIDLQYDESFESDEDTYSAETKTNLSRQSSDLDTKRTDTADEQTLNEHALVEFVEKAVGKVKRKALCRSAKSSKGEQEPSNPRRTAFIEKCIAKLQEQNNTDMITVHRQEERRFGETKDSPTGIPRLGFPWLFQIERMKAENLNRYLEKVAMEADIPHESSEKHGQIKTQEFIRRKIKVIDDRNLNEKYSRHITDKTSAMMIAEIIKSSVHPLGTREEIWMEFMKPLNISQDDEPMKAKTNP